MKHALRCALGALAATAALSQSAFAQSQPAAGFPDKPIRFIVPYAPGGNTDLIARTLSEKMSPRLGHTVVVDNRPGAGTLIGTELVARARPDGYTILLSTIATHAINPHLHQKVSYDAFRDFEPVILVARGPFLVVVPTSLPAKNIKELVALAQAKPGTVTFGSGGPGSPQHLAVEIFKSVAKVDMTHVPYKGSAPAIIDLVGAQISTMFDNTAMQFVKAGKLRAIAMTGVKRTPIAPEVPTIRESGIPYDFYTWQGVSAPANTPAPVIARLNAEMAHALKLPDVQQRLTQDGAEIMAGSPKEYGDWIKLEYGRMAKAVKDSGARAN
jgi:tripartite-type tricarboxylate transporter receptor subunit TctC